MADTQVGIWGWDSTTTQWRKVLVDAAGHLQVDVLTSALPGGGATAANQALIIADTGTLVAEQGRCYGWDGANWQRLRLESAAQHNLRVRLYSAGNAINHIRWDVPSVDAGAYFGLCSSAQLYLNRDATHSYAWYSASVLADARPGYFFPPVALRAWNGASYDRLRTESNVAFNLRVKLYDGANGIDSDLIDSNIFVSGERALLVRAQICGYNLEPFLQRRTDSDALAAVSRELCQFTISALYGYNGATFDRLRTYGTGILKVGRAEIDSTTIRVAAAGAVVAGAHNLYWVACSPDSPGAEWELTDAIAGGGAVKYDHFDPDKHSEHLIFDPPMKFTTGIWIEKFDHMHSLVFCYV